MKKFVLITTLLFSLTVHANCTTNTITTPEGKVIVCSTCCYNGNCNTFCF